MADRPLEAEMYEKYQGERNRLIDEGDAVEHTAKTRGWKLVLDRIEKERLTAMRNALLVSNESTGGRMWRERLATLDWVFAMIEGFIRERDRARRELESERTMQKEYGKVPEVSPEESLHY